MNNGVDHDLRSAFNLNIEPGADSFDIEIGRSPRFRDQPQLEPPIELVAFGDGQACPVYGDIGLREDLAAERLGNMHPDGFVAAHLARNFDFSRKIDMAGKRVAADIGPILSRPFGINHGSNRKFGYPLFLFRVLLTARMRRPDCLDRLSPSSLDRQGVLSDRQAVCAQISLRATDRQRNGDELAAPSEGL